MKNAKDDWDDDAAVESQELQGYIDRLQDRGEREVVRILKVRSAINAPNPAEDQTIEYEKRLAASFPSLDINPEIRERILAMALEDEQADPSGQSARAVVVLTVQLGQSLLLQIRPSGIRSS